MLVMRINAASKAGDFIFTLIHFSVAQSQAEIVTEGLFLRNPVLKKIYDI